jgi:hypothetical protein
MTDYQEAVQAPSACFADPELKGGTPVLNKLGLPRPICGQFASVYELQNGSARWAVKCFLRNIPDLHSRYAKIAAHLEKCGLPYFVTFEYLQKGVRVQGKFFPIVKMEWVEGFTLNEYVEMTLSDRNALRDLEERWLTLLGDLRSVRVGHGDLQHGNVLVDEDGNLRLIDYDGMWVPKLKGHKSNETGHPDFQSPLRTERDFNGEIDQFAGDVIHVAIRALARDPKLWQRYNNGDNLLFRRQDYLDPFESTLIADVKSMGDDEIRAKLGDLIEACGVKPKRGRPSRFFKPKRATSGRDAKRESADAGRSWKAKKEVRAAARPAPAAKAGAGRPARAKRAVAAGVAAAATGAAPASRPPARAPVQTPARKAAGTWLDDHVSARGRSRPRAPASRAPRASFGARLLGYIRLVIHILVVAPVAMVSLMELVTFLRDEGDQATAILMPAFGIATLLGLVSVMSLFVARVVHRAVSTLFFGVMVVIMLVNIFAGLLTDGSFGWTGDEPLQCALMLWMLGLGALGLIIEFACHRVGVVTSWRRP